VGDGIVPCANNIAWAHVVIAGFGVFNACLTTWLTLRAKRRDRAENRRRISARR